MKALRPFQVFLIVFIVAVINCAIEEPGERQPYRSKNDVNASKEVNLGISTTIVGTVAVFEDKTVIMTSGEDYDIVGNELEPYIGKRVRITGTVNENLDHLTIKPKTVEVVE